jgi:transcriptional regulator with PAS, ATPase and Fis domain
MIALNCAALASELVEAELFGHTKGAFTGAHASRAGHFEQANRSSIFLDEIGELPFAAQAKLLRVIQEREVQRLGGSETVRVDVRVIAASNVALAKAVQEGRFREDLYYRLNVVPIEVPPLRQRREDIPLLLDHFLEKVRLAEHAPAKHISPEAVQLLANLEWAGNVRQLENAVQRAFVLSGERRRLDAHDFSSWRTGLAGCEGGATPTSLIVPHNGLGFEEAVASVERSLLNQALTLSRNNKARAARLLRIKRTTLLAKLKALEITGNDVGQKETRPKLFPIPPQTSSAARPLSPRELCAQLNRLDDLDQTRAESHSKMACA